jgi:glycosyltransferase involved in cell wall biosynthesis
MRIGKNERRGSLGSFPLVSCIMPTYNRRLFFPRAVEYFQRQDYSNRELIIVDDGTDPVIDLVPDDPCILYLRVDEKCTIGAKRNLACEESQGEIIVHWDDDDWMAPWRLSYQRENLQREKADICGLERLFFFDPVFNRAWQYAYPGGERQWLAGGTLCYTKSFWRRNPFPAINVGEDTRFVWSSLPKKVLALKENSFYVALIHTGNSSHKRKGDDRWREYPSSTIRDFMGDDLDFYTGKKVRDAYGHT